jgi:hypothetical protein
MFPTTPVRVVSIAMAAAAALAAQGTIVSPDGLANVPGNHQPIAIASSQGRGIVVPAPHLTTVVPVTRLAASVPNLPNHPNAYNEQNGIGYGLITEFTHQ